MNDLSQNFIHAMRSEWLGDVAVLREKAAPSFAEVSFFRFDDFAAADNFSMAGFVAAPETHRVPQATLGSFTPAHSLEASSFVGRDFMASNTVRNPEFAPVEISSAAPTDPLFAQQWHFSRMGDIQTIWDEYTGAGVSVGVYDSNIDIGHADLSANHDPSLRVAYGGVTASDDLNPGSVDTQDHGTSVAGLISAANNGDGVVGVAFGSTFTGVAIFDETTNFFVNGNAAQSAGLFAVLATLNFDLVNHSWGSLASYGSSQNLSNSSSFWSQVTGAWKEQADDGRGGLGTIVLKASGNDSRNANASGENSARWIIDVAAVSDLDLPASYSNHGANILVSGLGSEFASRGGLGIVTTDVSGTAGYNLRADPSGDHDYTDDFGGTSAATPIVSGVVALMLEANPDLGWRDVQNILAVTATHVGSAIGATTAGTYENAVWQINGADNWNGGGLHFHSNYGFGVVNAFNAVRMSEVWGLFSGAAKTSANELSVSISATPALAIIDNDTVSTTFEITDDLRIENLQLTLGITHSWFADLRISLTAPDGSVYILEDGTGNSGNSTAADSGLLWTYGVNALREQSSLGIWTITITDTDPLDAGTLDSFTASFYGSAPSTDDVYHFTDEFSDLVALDASRGTITDTDGGTDWLNLATTSGDLTVFLTNSGATLLDGVFHFSLAPGTVIENAIAGDGDDLLTGNDLANFLYGMRGNDTLKGADGADLLDGGVGNDILIGGDGDDILSGGLGADAMTGGLGNDRYNVDDIGDSVSELAGEGIDTVRSLIDFDALESEIEFIRAFSHRAQTLTASDIDTAIFGGLGDDTLIGGAGKDRLFGGDDDDDLYGNAGHDRLFGGSGADMLSGGIGNDRLIGGDGEDELFGGEDNDRLIGGLGADMMAGGIGDDIYYVDDAGDTVSELAGEGVDTVRTIVDFDAGGSEIEIIRSDTASGVTLTASNISTKLFGGSGDDTLFGGDAADRLTGGSGGDILSGGAGRDILFGGSGADELTGGADNDLFGFDEGDSGASLIDADHITDFSQSDGDLIDLSRIDAISGGADDTFTFIGSSTFSNIAGELRFEQIDGETRVFGDIDGDSVADFVIIIDSTIDLLPSDFVL